MSWTVQHQELDDIYWIEDENHQTIADLYFKKGDKAYFKFPNAEENAPILGASLEMLEALEAMTEYAVSTGHYNSEIVALANAAIRKARSINRTLEEVKK